MSDIYNPSVGSVGSVTSVDVSGGTTGLIFTGGPVTSSGTITAGGTLGVANGGTGATTAGGSPFWALGGNSVASAQNFGTTTNFDVPIITNNTEVARFGANGLFRLGAGTPAAKLHITGNVSAAAWTSNGIAIRQDSATYTDTTSSGSVGSVYINNLAGGTITASSATTYTSAYGLNVLPPVAGTNVTITNNYAFRAAGMCRIDGNVSIGSGIVPVANLEVGGALSVAAWGANGIGVHLRTATYTDTTSSGTVALTTVNSFSAATIAASSSTTYTAAANVYISGAPIPGTNVTITNAYSLYVAAGSSFFGGAINSNLTGAVLNGTTAGTVTSYQSFQGTSLKVFTAIFAGYENNTVTNQTITFPVAFTGTPVVVGNNTTLTITATTTTLTIAAPNNTTLFNGNVVVIGV